MQYIFEYKDYTLIKIETTGQDYSENEIIELAAIRIRDNQKAEVFQSFVKPQNKIEQSITDANGITNEMVESAGSINEVLPKFLEFVGSDTVVGHNVVFDMKFIETKIHELSIVNTRFANSYIETLGFTNIHFCHLPNQKLPTLTEHLEIPSTISHRSLADCEAVHELVKILCKYEREAVTIRAKKEKKLYAFVAVCISILLFMYFTTG
ncbi:3'-5' exonuclease [Selenomonadales bacterium OttesenSCG-928-I06]|nr:3'-5' exonuclease [Selenomonadales bacterium OttesenSCG-928-I06]